MSDCNVPYFLVYRSIVGMNHDARKGVARVDANAFCVIKDEDARRKCRRIVTGPLLIAHLRPLVQLFLLAY